MSRFKVGDYVRWVRIVSSLDRKNSTGNIRAIVIDDQEDMDFTMYEIDFDFGTRKLYGIQLEIAQSRESEPAVNGPNKGKSHQSAA